MSFNRFEKAETTVPRSVPVVGALPYTDEWFGIVAVPIKAS